MVTIYNTEVKNIFDEENEYITGEFRGLSTDDKPTKVKDKFVDNGAIFIEIDTGKIYMYDLDSETWNEV